MQMPLLCRQRRSARHVPHLPLHLSMVAVPTDKQIETYPLGICYIAIENGHL